MLSGRETLGHINATLKSARGEMGRLEQELQRTSDAVARNRMAQTAALKHLAGVRLDEIASGNIRQHLDGVDYQVEQLLEQRAGEMAKLEQQIRRTEAEREALETQRDEQHEVVDAKARTLAEREAAVQANLNDDGEFQDQLAATRAADAIAVSAADKAAMAEADRNAKGAPYESDELFSYLWSRGYGTSEYSAGALARFLDGWVARLCGYEEARQNYWMLLEIPKRLDAHADRVRAAADDELGRLQALEQVAAKAGGVVAASASLAEAEEIQDEIDVKISEQEEALNRLRTELSQYAVAEDEYSVKCLQVLAEAMGRRNILQLTSMAGSTLTPEDDALVDELRQLRRADDQLQSELRQHRDMLQEQHRRQQELESVRRKFKNSRYDDLRSTFDKGDLLVMMMRQVLGGGVEGGALWDAIRRQQRYQDVGGAWPDFGSGGIVRGGRRGQMRPPTWHWPGGNTGRGRRGGGFRLPRAPRSSRSRGGFRTGGGF